MIELGAESEEVEVSKEGEDGMRGSECGERSLMKCETRS